MDPRRRTAEAGKGGSLRAAREFLAIYLETDVSHLPLHADHVLKATWAGDAAYVARVRAFIQAQRSAYGAMAHMPVARNYFSDVDGDSLRLNIRFFASDARDGDRTALPGI
jgi:hypothetical protein